MQKLPQENSFSKNNIRLSIIIPSYKDPYSQKTIKSLLDGSELGDQLEIIQVFDGYWPDFELTQDPRVRYVHIGKNGGMRRSINAGVSIARGEFLMRTDEHCAFDKGFDKKMTDACRPDWIMSAIQYALDPVKWEVMKEVEPTIYQKLVIQGKDGEVQKFSGQRWRSRDKANAHKMIDQTMAMQGSCWVMPHAWWDKVIGELQTEGYGPAYQDSTEMIFKTWQAGGKMVLNKNTWFAHKHRSFNRTHNEGTKENPWIREQSWKYALDTWRDYYENKVRKVWGI